jgi:heptosyltransferase-2/heptosyltransferase-3
LQNRDRSPPKKLSIRCIQTVSGNLKPDVILRTALHEAGLPATVSHPRATATKRLSGDESLTLHEGSGSPHGANASARTPGAVVVRFGRLGDTVLLQPLLQRLHQRFGKPCTLLSRGGWPQPLYDGHADVGRIIQLDAAHRPLLLSPQRWRAIRALRHLRNLPFYICDPEPRALAKIRRLLSWAGIAADHCVFLTDMPERTDEHWIDRLLRFSDHIPAAFDRACYPIPPPAAIAAPRMQVSDADRSDCAAWLQKRGLTRAPLILLQPANKRSMRWNGVRGPDDDKWWPSEHWAALACAIRLSLPAAQVLLCGAADEASYLHDIRNASANAGVHVVAEELPLRRLMALLAIAYSMVSVDTGPAHLAAAMGCPLVTLFGRFPPEHWLQRSSTGSEVIGLGGPARGGRVDALSFDEVFAAWRWLAPRVSATAVAAGVFPESIEQAP